MHAGSGSVGQAAIQYAVLWGATVIATSSERRFDRVRELGAIPVAYGEGLADRVRAAAPQGVTVALDAAGTDEAIQASLELVEDRDRIVTLVRGRDAASFGIRAFSGGSPTPLTARELAWRREAIPVTIALMAAGRFSVELGPSFPLAEAPQRTRPFRTAPTARSRSSRSRQAAADARRRGRAGGDEPAARVGPLAPRAGVDGDVDAGERAGESGVGGGDRPIRSTRPPASPP